MAHARLPPQSQGPPPGRGRAGGPGSAATCSKRHSKWKEDHGSPLPQPPCRKPRGCAHKALPPSRPTYLRLREDRRAAPADLRSETVRPRLPPRARVPGVTWKVERTAAVRVGAARPPETARTARKRLQVPPAAGADRETEALRPVGQGTQAAAAGASPQTGGWEGTEGRSPRRRPGSRRPTDPSAPVRLRPRGGAKRSERDRVAQSRSLRARGRAVRPCAGSLRAHDGLPAGLRLRLDPRSRSRAGASGPCQLGSAARGMMGARPAPRCTGERT